MDSLCHPWFTTTNLSYRFPIFETSATALCGTTGRQNPQAEVSFHVFSNMTRYLYRKGNCTLNPRLTFEECVGTRLPCKLVAGEKTSCKGWSPKKYSDVFSRSQAPRKMTLESCIFWHVTNNGSCWVLLFWGSWDCVGMRWPLHGLERWAGSVRIGLK